ncbi:MAG: hypothetical protein K6D56_00825 [Clostridia bacterium]|nr:hypothetical protein [Clostridia bacterium]
MSEATVVIKTIEQFRDFVQNNNISELVSRDAKKKFKTFYKFAFDELQQSEKKEVAQKVLDAVSKNTNLLKDTVEKIDQFAKLQNIGLVINGMNLCATCAGFAIMYKKLDSMSAEIQQQIGEVKQILKDTNHAQLNFKVNEVLEEHMDMLDCKKKGKPYSEEKMRILVSEESVLLKYLIDVLNYNISSNKETLIFSILSVASMFTASLQLFDEIYYFNNKDVHSAHDLWMEVYEVLVSNDVIKKIQECGFLDMNLSTVLTDELYLSFEEQTLDFKKEVEDNLKLVQLVGNEDNLKAFNEFSNDTIKNELEEAFKEAFSQDTDSKKAYETSMNRVCQID